MQIDIPHWDSMHYSKERNKEYPIVTYVFHLIDCLFDVI